MKKWLLGVALVLLMSDLCLASFYVYLKDGSSKLVNKIEFKEQFAELHLTNGSIIRIRVEAIEYRVTGIERPAFPFGVCVDGKTVKKLDKPEEPAVVIQQVRPTTTSQDELKRLWDGGGEVVTAKKNFGSIGKGQKAKVVSSSPLTVTIVYMDDSTRQLRRLVMDSEAYTDVFGIKETNAAKPKPASEPVMVDVPTGPVASKRVFVPPAPIKVESLPLWVPPVMSLGFLVLGVLISLVVYRNPPVPAKSRR